MTDLETADKSLLYMYECMKQHFNHTVTKGLLATSKNREHRAGPAYIGSENSTIKRKTFSPFAIFQGPHSRDL